MTLFDVSLGIGFVASVFTVLAGIIFLYVIGSWLRSLCFYCRRIFLYVIAKGFKH